jgi:hypothetical protein
MGHDKTQLQRSKEMSENNDYDDAGPGWVKKGDGLWEYKGEKGKENPWKEHNEMTPEQIAKEKEEFERLEREEIRKLKEMGCLPEDYDYDEERCPGCGDPILPRHEDKVMRKTFLHAECSVCNVGFTDTTQEYTEIFTYFGGAEIEDNYEVYPDEIPEWTSWKCPFHPDGHMAVTQVDSVLGIIERIGKDGKIEYISTADYELASTTEENNMNKKAQE